MWVLYKVLVLEGWTWRLSAAEKGEAECCDLKGLQQHQVLCTGDFILASFIWDCLYSTTISL